MNLNDYKLVWSDEFDYEGRPDETKWSFETGNFQWPNKELQAYTDRPGNVFVKDGCLTIRARKEQDGEREYTSAKITTADRASWQYGYFEVRAKFPRGLGSWPAIWLMPQMEKRVVPEGLPTLSNGMPDYNSFTEDDFKRFPLPPEENRWPNCGEIDMVEHIGRRENLLLFSLHSKRHNHMRHDTASYTTSVMHDGSVCDDFHTYGMEWTEDYFEYFVDGKSMCRYNRSDDKEDQGYDSWPFDKPFRLIMNIAVGGGLGGPVDDSALPFEMLVEYVRVYQKK